MAASSRWQGKVTVTEINPYIRVLWYREAGEMRMPGGFNRSDAYIPLLSEQIRAALSKNDTDEKITNVDELAQELFSELVQAGAFAEETHQFAGTYYQFSKNNFAQVRTNALGGDAINSTAERIGTRFFPDTFRGYLGQRNLDDLEAASRGAIALPASDRIVFLGDNMQEIVTEIEQLKVAVRSDNDEEGKLEGRRDRVVSELSAGQELLKSPSVRTKAIISVLVSTLSFISAEFAGGLIGDLAVKLLEQLRPLLGL